MLGAAYDFRRFLSVAGASGILAVLVAHIPLPQFGTDARTYTRAIGFFLAPLFPVPALSSLLAGLQPYEHQAARGLLVCRLGVCMTSALLAFALLAPAAMVAPTPDPLHVLLENLLAVVGLTLALSCWVSSRWAWAVIYAVTLVGISSPESGPLARYAFADRVASPTDLVVGALEFVIGLLLYAARGPRR